MVKEIKYLDEEEKYLKSLGIIFTLAGIILILVSYILVNYFVVTNSQNESLIIVKIAKMIQDFGFMGRDFGIGIFTTGVIILIYETKKAKITKNSDIESIRESMDRAIKKTIRNEFLNPGHIDSNEIKKQVITSLEKGAKTIRNIKLNYYIDLRDISTYPALGEKLGYFLANEIKGRVTDFNSENYGIICPKSENTYLATKVADFLHVPLIFVNVKEKDIKICENCDSNNCQFTEEFVKNIKSRDEDSIFDGVLLETKKYILLDDITLTGETQCFSSELVKRIKNIEITYAIILILRNEVGLDKVKSKLMRHSKHFEAIWKLDDNEIAKIKNE